jgi:hypothetical protein
MASDKNIRPSLKITKAKKARDRAQLVIHCLPGFKSQNYQKNAISLKYFSNKKYVSMYMHKMKGIT